MSGHSKWSTIKRKKGLADAKKGNVFTKHSRVITVAARSGGDPEMNAMLRTAIDNARADNMPIANIERAIKKGTGEDKDGVIIETLIYEGYAPGGAAVLAKALTDNKNRTTPEVKKIFSNNGGNLGESGCVAWMFEERGVVVVTSIGEAIELAAIEAGADDIVASDGKTIIYTKREELMKVKTALISGGIVIESSELSMIAKEIVTITNVTDAKKVLALLDELEEHDDIVDVASNFDMSEAVLAELSQ